MIFGSGTLSSLRAEVERVGRARVLVLSGPALLGAAERVRELLGPYAVASFGDAAMHTPVEVTARALDLLHANAADCLLAVGGGSTIGLSKALALRTELPQIVVPTTYAGSELTPILGQTSNGVKSTLRSDVVLPRTVVYDVDLTLGLPVALSVVSAGNALAHAVEALYAPDTTDRTSRPARTAIAAIARALPVVASNPRDVAARTALLSAARDAGACLGAVRMGLHHKLCHVLGGSFGLPHAETHTVVLPHVIAYNAPAVPEPMREIALALGASSAAAGVYDLTSSLGAPTSLRDLGLSEADVPAAAQLATEGEYPNPRHPTAADLEQLLHHAWLGTRPA
ncbi:maleylacetate reductase [Flindersiella endophytica]